MSPEEKSREVESIIDLLELRSFADMIVGEEATGEGVCMACGASSAESRLGTCGC